jgi:glycolate oxidase FAD binding subunit
MGTLGVLTELTFRVFPKDARVACFAVRGIDVAAGHALLRRVWSSPIDATALRYVPDGATHGSALIRFEGALDEKTAMLSALAAPHELLAENDAASFPNDGRSVWRVALPPASAPLFGPGAIGDWAGALLWASGDDVRERAARLGGTATLIRASAETRSRIAPFTPEAPVRAALTRGVKAAFDPLALFNPGRMFEGV